MTTARPGATAKTAGRPVGRHAAVAAVLSAAADLFAERGPAATSVRDIVVRSGVNHGLVYRHLGTKEQLVGAVLDYLSDESAAAADSEAADVVDRGLTDTCV